MLVYTLCNKSCTFSHLTQVFKCPRIHRPFNYPPQTRVRTTTVYTAIFKKMNKNSSGRASDKTPTTPETDMKSIKVKYISSPVMVEAKDASQFKEIVQHFTGQTPIQTSYGVYSNPTTPATTTTGEATRAHFSYEPSNKKPQALIDSFSWEDIAEWNSYR